MTKKKKIEVRITHPIRLGNREYLPGETATVPEDIAQEWILTERARLLAEVKWQQEEP